jgi:hypothetical protein
MMLFGGAGAAFLAARPRKRFTDLRHSRSKNMNEGFPSPDQPSDGIVLSKCRRERAD